MTEVDYDLAGWVSASSYREQVVAELTEGPSTPSTLAERLDIKISHVSNTLTDLRSRGAAELLVEDSRQKGRIYGLTDKGHAVAETVEEHDF